MGRYSVDPSTGDLSLIAGRGKAEYGASTVRTGTIVQNTAISANNIEIYSATFSSPMPDTDYCIDFSFVNQSNYLFTYEVQSKTVNGFSILIGRPSSSNMPANSITINYKAYKLYTDNEYNDILTKMPELLSGRTTILTSSDDIDAITEPGTYSWNDTANAPANVPLNLTYAILVHVLGAANGHNEQQFIFKGSQGIILVRSLSTTSPRVWGDWNKFYAANDEYSTSEKVVGTWINGKPIYRKVVEFGALPNATSKNVAHGISNLDYIVSINTTAKYNTNYISIPYVDETTLANSISISIRNTNIRISSGADQSMYTATVVIEYTKTV